MEVGDGPMVRVGGSGIMVGVDVLESVEVAGMGVRVGVIVSAVFIDIGVGSGRDGRQAVRIKKNRESERLSNMFS
jgi:hypothetical protein